MERTSASEVVEFLKKSVSMGLLVFSTITVTINIFEGETRLSNDMHPVLAFFALLVSLLWLSRVEGGQACMVGLPPVDRKLYKGTHPITSKICKYGHQGNNLDRFLMGRQFMVLAFVFVVNWAGAPTEDAEYRIAVTEIFMNSGIAVILITAMIGQLTTQVTASTCMLDYANTHAMTITLYVAIAIEASGILHSAYLIHFIFAKITGRDIVSNEPPRSCFGNLVFWFKVLYSTGLLFVAFYVTMTAIFERKTTMWGSVPPTASLILLLVLMTIVGILEGMQIAFFAVARVTEAERNHNVWSRWSCQLAFGGNGKGLPRFLIGRQLCVASCFIIIARITTPGLDDNESNILGVGDTAQKFLETGLLSALITTIVASIAWQLMAATCPVEFLGNPVTYAILRVSLLLEATGICSFALVLSEAHQEFLGFEPDEEHIGTAEERAAMGFADKMGNIGAMAGAAFTADFGLQQQRHRNLYSTDDLEECVEDLQDQLRGAKTTAEKTEIQREIKFLEKLVQEREQTKKKKFFGGNNNSGADTVAAATATTTVSATESPVDEELARAAARGADQAARGADSLSS